MNRRHMGILVLTVLLAQTALAGTLAGVNLPDSVTVDGKNLVLNGLGLRSKLFVKVYVGALYIEKKSGDAAAIIAADAPKRLVMHFLHDVSKEKLAGAWDEGFAKNVKPNPDGSVFVTGKLNAMMEDMKPGDELSLTYVPGKGTEVMVNSKLKGNLPDLGFAKALFSVFLGAEPPTEELKKGLLGG